MIGRYEFHDEETNSHKFWELKESGFEYIATWGRIGTKGQSTVYDEGTAAKKAREKLAKGYEKVQDGIAIPLQRKEAQQRVAEKRAVRKAEHDEAIDFMEELRKVR